MYFFFFAASWGLTEAREQRHALHARAEICVANNVWRKKKEKRNMRPDAEYTFLALRVVILASVQRVFVQESSSFLLHGNGARAWASKFSIGFLRLVCLL